MIIFPAIDLSEDRAVRLYKGDFAQKTVYSDSPLSVAEDFVRKGATHVHLVDLDGARTGARTHFDLIATIKNRTGLFTEVGGGIRTYEDVAAYLGAGVDRVILGTVAVEDPDFIRRLPAAYRDRVAVGVDVKDNLVAIKGWTETSRLDVFDFCARLEAEGVRTVICTDVGRDGAMQGTNGGLYQALASRFSLNVVASGGVSSIEDVLRLRGMNLYGAIIGKAYYVGAIDLTEAIEVSK